MPTVDSLAGSSRGSSSEARTSDETLVGVGPLPKKQGELGWTASQDDLAQTAQTTSTDDLQARHPADRPSSPEPANASTASLQSHSSIFKQFLRKRRPLPRINGTRASTVLRVSLLVATIIGSIVGWIVTVMHMNAWNAQANSTPSPTPVEQPIPSSGNSTAPVAPMPSQQQFTQMTNSSIVFVHVAFGAAVLFQLLMLERAVYRLRAERYAFLHPDEMAAAAGGGGGGVMSLAPWNRPPLPTYAAALGVRGTGDVEDNVIAAPPPPEYGNTRGSTLLLSAHLDRSSSTSNFRPPSQRTLRDVLGRSVDAWSRPVSYSEDELRQDARRSMDLETALSRLEGAGTMSEVGSTSVTRPENAVLRA